ESTEIIRSQEPEFNSFTTVSAPGRNSTKLGTPSSTAQVTNLPRSRRALPSPSSDPMASPSGPTWVTIRTFCAASTAAVACAQSSLLVIRVRLLRWNLKAGKQAIYPFASFERNIPVKVQFGHSAQAHTLADFAAQEALCMSQTAHYIVLTALISQRIDVNISKLEFRVERHLGDSNALQTGIGDFAQEQFAENRANTFADPILFD